MDGRASRHALGNEGWLVETSGRGNREARREQGAGRREKGEGRRGLRT